MKRIYFIIQLNLINTKQIRTIQQSCLTSQVMQEAKFLNILNNIKCSLNKLNHAAFYILPNLLKLAPIFSYIQRAFKGHVEFIYILHYRFGSLAKFLRIAILNLKDELIVNLKQHPSSSV